MICELWQECFIKKVTDLTMIYFIMPKQPTNLQANLRIVPTNLQPTNIKANLRGLDPGSDHLVFRIFLFISKKKCVRAFSQPESTNQPVTIFSTGRSEKRKNQHSWLWVGLSKALGVVRVGF